MQMFKYLQQFAYREKDRYGGYRWIGKIYENKFELLGLGNFM